MDARNTELTIPEQAIHAGFEAGEIVWNRRGKMAELAVSIEKAFVPCLLNTAYNTYWRAGFTAGFLGMRRPTPTEVDRVAL